jgi:flagellar motility protein MotE (MotC chaperone)
MIRFAREFRLIPIVLLATISLFALKVSGLVLDGGYTLAERMEANRNPGLQTTTAADIPDYPKITIADRAVMPDAAPSPRSWAKEMFYSDGAKGDVTGSVGEGADKAASGPPLKVTEKAPEPAKLEIGGAAYPLEPGKMNSPGERAVLERLQDRRQELDARTKDLEMRESLLKAAESRVEAKIGELKDMENRVKAAMGARDKAEADRFKSIVSMYENMKPKDAARIFDRLDMKILVDVATQMNSRKMSDVLAQMTSESAERLTVELANRANASMKSVNSDQLPKIDGKPSN